jgi:hypothetical protein
VIEKVQPPSISPEPLQRKSKTRTALFVPQEGKGVEELVLICETTKIGNGSDTDLGGQRGTYYTANIWGTCIKGLSESGEDKDDLTRI